MTLDHLVTMVNDISAFFAADAGASAPDAVASHLQRFWAPSMRQQIIAAYRGHDPAVDRLSGVAKQAVASLADGPRAG